MDFISYGVYREPHHLSGSVPVTDLDSCQLAANDLGPTATNSCVPQEMAQIFRPIMASQLPPASRPTLVYPPYPSLGGQSSHSSAMAPINANREPNDNSFDFKRLADCVENLKENSDTFQTNILTELRQLREVVENMRTSFQEMPIRFADVLTQCLDSGTSRSENASVTSEPEVVEMLDKIDIKNDVNEEGFVDVLARPEISANVDPMTAAAVDKFVFEYNSYIDLEKWLKRD